MKHLFLLTSASLLMLYGCNSKQNPENKDDNKEPENVETVEISIDGDFSDWENVKESNEDGTVLLFANEDEGMNSMQNMAITSDADFIYFYLTIATNKIQTGEGGKHGDSNTGHGLSTPGPIWVYLDADDNSKTGLIPHWLGDIDTGAPLFRNLGFDNAVQIYIWLATETGMVDMGWSQLNIQPSYIADGTSIDEAGSWAVTDENPNGYGWFPEYDNTLVTFDNFKTKVKGAVTQVEFAIDRSLVRGMTSATKSVGVGVAYQCGDTKGTWDWSGRLPSKGEPTSLNLINE